MAEGKPLRILVIGGRIGGLTAAIALRRKGFAVDVFERDPDWSLHGVGVIQQGNVVRAAMELGILDDYVGAGFPFEELEIYRPDGTQAARVPTPKLAESYPADIGIGHPALHKVLGDRAIAAGATVRLGLTAETLDDDGAGMNVVFADASSGRWDIVVGGRRALLANAQGDLPERA